MIKCVDIHKNYGDLEVLKGVDLTIAEAEVVTIVGPSGAGKSTLLQIMGSLSKTDRGRVEIGGVDISQMTEKELSAFRNKNIGFVFQFHHLLNEFTALENVIIPALIGGKSRKESEKEAQRLLEVLGLSQRTDHKPAQLSGGEQQRVAIARALINRPEVLFADEPSGNLDTKTREELHRLFFDLRDQFKQTIVIVTHDTHLAGLSDRSIEIVDGRIVR